MNSPAGRGKFIVLEGIDGSGKTTQIRKLTKFLQSEEIRCHVTKEPTESPIGSVIRQILTGRIQSDPRGLANLFAADRTDHLLNPLDGLCKMLQNGITVVCDRYYFSSYAYHSADVDMDWVISVNSVNAGLLRPDLTLFLDIPVRDALTRIHTVRVHTELFEKEERLLKVRENYLCAFEKLKGTENYAIIDGCGTEDEVFQRIQNIVSAYL